MPTETLNTLLGYSFIIIYPFYSNKYKTREKWKYKTKDSIWEYT